MDIFDYVGAVHDRACIDKRACGILGNEINIPVKFLFSGNDIKIG